MYRAGDKKSDSSLVYKLLFEKTEGTINVIIWLHGVDLKYFWRLQTEFLGIPQACFALKK